jgi:plastocyanin
VIVAKRVPLVVALLAAGGLMTAGGGAGAATTPSTTCKRVLAKKTVRINDNFYLPDALKVKRCTKVTWVWPTDTGDTHDVKLAGRPKGVKIFQSQAAATGYSYPRTLAVKGTYKIICTFHEGDMQMMIRVS